MLCAYCSILHPSINNINPQPHALMNQVKAILDKSWEYVGYEPSYKEVKAQVNVYLKNRRHALKNLIEASALRPDDCPEDHWDNLKHLVTSEAKQEETIKSYAMRAHMNTLSHFGHGGELGIARKLVRFSIVTLFHTHFHESI